MTHFIIKLYTALLVKRHTCKCYLRHDFSRSNMSNMFLVVQTFELSESCLTKPTNHETSQPQSICGS